jgi:hypothetical protein
MQTVQEVRSVKEVDLELLEYLTLCVRVDPSSTSTSYVHSRMIADLIAKYGSKVLFREIDLINERLAK